MWYRTTGPVPFTNCLRSNNNAKKDPDGSEVGKVVIITVLGTKYNLRLYWAQNFIIEKDGRERRFFSVHCVENGPSTVDLTTHHVGLSKNFPRLTWQHKDRQKEGKEEKGQILHLHYRPRSRRYKPGTRVNLLLSGHGSYYSVFLFSSDSERRVYRDTSTAWSGPGGLKPEEHWFIYLFIGALETFGGEQSKDNRRRYMLRIDDVRIKGLPLVEVSLDLF